MEHALDARERQLERVGGDLGAHGFQALPERGRADIDRNGSVRVENEARALARSRCAAFEITADAQPVIASVDELALQRSLLAPADLGDAAVERGTVVAAVRLRLEIE